MQIHHTKQMGRDKKKRDTTSNGSIKSPHNLLTDGMFSLLHLLWLNQYMKKALVNYFKGQNAYQYGPVS